MLGVIPKPNPKSEQKSLETFEKRSGYGTTHGSSYFKTYSTIPPHMMLFE